MSTLAVRGENLARSQNDFCHGLLEAWRSILGNSAAKTQLRKEISTFFNKCLALAHFKLYATFWCGKIPWSGALPLNK